MTLWDDQGWSTATNGTGKLNIKTSLNLLTSKLNTFLMYIYDRFEFNNI